MNQTHLSEVLACAIALGAAACNGGGKTDSASAPGKAHDDVIAILKEHVAIIAAYMPFLQPKEAEDKYAPKRHADREKSSLCAANEIRHAANFARQRFPHSAVVASKEIDPALVAVATSCADAEEPQALDKCAASVKALDEALGKSDAAASAAGASAKYPRVAPAAVTEDAKKAMAPFLRARGPSAAEKTFVEKRGDATVASSDLVMACQAAADDADQTAKDYDKGDEAVRLVAVMHKMSMDSQCNTLTTTESLRKDIEGCRKKPKSDECKAACSKSRPIVTDGVPAATFAPFVDEVAEVCKDDAAQK